MASEDHHFLSSSLYSAGILVSWDPGPYSSDLREVRAQPYLTVKHLANSQNPSKHA